MKLKNKLSILLTISPIMVSPLFLAASCKEKDKNNPQLKEFKDKLEKLQNSKKHNQHQWKNSLFCNGWFNFGWIYRDAR